MSMPQPDAQALYLKQYHLARMASLQEQRRYHLALIAAIEREIETLRQIAPSIDICYNDIVGRTPGPSQTK